MEVDKLVSGAVLLRVPDELAWTTFIDGKDSETIGTVFSLPSFALSNQLSRGIWP
jgi:hypothetical protein